MPRRSALYHARRDCQSRAQACLREAAGMPPVRFFFVSATRPAGRRYGQPVLSTHCTNESMSKLLTRVSLFVSAFARTHSGYAAA